MDGVQQQVLQNQLQQLGIRVKRRSVAVDLNRHVAGTRILAHEADHHGQDRQRIDRRHPRLRRAREEQQILHQIVQRVDPRHDLLDDVGVPTVGRQPAADDLHRPANAGQRILHFVRHHGGHLAEPRQRRLLAQLRLELHARREVVQNPRKLRLPVDHHFTDGQVDWKRRPVLSASGHFAADADDALLAGREIPAHVLVVLVMVRLRHQDVDVAADDVL